MRVLLMLTLVLGFISCGDDEEEKKKEDTIVSCALASTPETAVCVDYKNAANVESGCTQLEGTYAAEACVVDVGIKGCSKTNASGVETTTWYKGAAYTGDEPLVTVESQCDEDGETVVTKE